MHFFHWPRQMPEARVILDTCSRQHPCFHDTLARLSIQTLAEVEWFVAYVRILTSPSASNLPPNNSYEEKNCCENYKLFRCVRARFPDLVTLCDLLLNTTIPVCLETSLPASSRNPPSWQLNNVFGVHKSWPIGWTLLSRF